MPAPPPAPQIVMRYGCQWGLANDFVAHSDYCCLFFPADTKNRHHMELNRMEDAVRGGLGRKLLTTEQVGVAGVWSCVGNEQ